MSTATTGTGAPGRDSRFLIVPALTFLAGLLLGGLLVWVGSDLSQEGPDGGDVASPAETEGGENPASPAEPTPTDVVMTVPGECLEAAQRAQELLDVARQTTEAIGDLDAQRLRSLVDQMEELEPGIRQSAQGCQQQPTDS